MNGGGRGPGTRARFGGRRARVPSLVACCVALLALPAPAAAQAGIPRPVAGVVTEDATGAPLPGVYVELLTEDGRRTGAAALTDDAGRFAVRGEEGARYRIRAERVGLATTLTDGFAAGAEAGLHRIRMSERAVELEGLTVRTPVRVCLLDSKKGVVVQRWWDEVRKALQSAAFVEANELEPLTFERFLREWSPDLRWLRAERAFPVDAGEPRPFLSPDAETLSRSGFVRGEAGERLFLAPDAAALLSDAFLRDHCLGVDGGGERRPGTLQLSVEPIESRALTDIRGVLEIDTLNSELRTFDFEYVNLPGDIPSSAAAGGHLAFEYLPSGAWIVSEWWVRMPWVERVRFRGRMVRGYVDEGGRVTGLPGGRAEEDAGASGATLAGVVYDSLFGRPLSDARVSVLGTRRATRTGADGRFRLAGVPPGRRGVTVHHEELARLGVPSPVAAVELEGGAVDSVTLAIPGFAVVSGLLCGDSTEVAGSILTGQAFEPGADAPAATAEVRARWIERGGVEGRTGSAYLDGRAAADGRYVLCGLPAGVSVALAVQVDSSWRAAGVTTLPERAVAHLDLRPGSEEPDAVVWGHVTDRRTGNALAGARVALVDSVGEVVARVETDVTGDFRLVAPRAGAYRAEASISGYRLQSSERFHLVEGEMVDVHFTLGSGRGARSVRGTVLDAVTGRGIPLADVSLLTGDGRPVALALADSAGGYVVTVPDAGAYTLLARSLGYLERELPLVDLFDGDAYLVDLSLTPEAIELDSLVVTVPNERVLEWLTLLRGENPSQRFGFRILQGARLLQAKRRARENATQTLRWLYVPVWHGGSCVSVGVPGPRSAGQTLRGGRIRPFAPGAVPPGTRILSRVSRRAADLDCGSLYVDGRRIRNDLIDDIDMSQVAVVAVAPGEVRMFTYAFDRTFRPEVVR